MTTSNKNKRKILAVLLAALAVSVVYRITHPFKQERVDTLTFAGKAESTSGSISAGYQGNPTDIMLNFIDAPPPHSGKVVKNIFSAGSSAHGTKSKADPGVKKTDKAAVAADEKNSGIGSQAKTGSEFSGIKVFGMYENEQDKVVFLERGKEILALREGDIIDGEFKVQTISGKMVTITSKHSDEPLFIDMNELENN